MTNTAVWLAFDIGTTGTKAALVSSEGEVLLSAYREYPTYTADGGIMEQNPADWWRAAFECARELTAQRDADDIGGIALTGQMQDLILVGTDGSPLRRAILYGDTRARTEADEINEKLGTERLKQITANEQDASGLLAKLLWLARNERNALALPGALLLGAADYLAFRLTGKAVSDTTTASTTGLLEFDKRELLDRRVFDLLGVGNAMRRMLPEIQPGGSYVGTVTQIAAYALGVAPGLPVYSGPGDAGAITLGVGAGEIGHVYGYIGTSGWIGFTSTTRARADGSWTLAHPHPERTIQVAPLLTAGGNLDWVRDLFGTDDYATLFEQALWRDPTTLLYLPYLQGERSPFRDPLARGALVGMDTRTEKADVYRAVLEGVAFAFRHAFESLVDSPIQQLTLTGGGTRTQAWNQLFADILNIPVNIAADAEFVGVRGATLAAQVSSGQFNTYAPEGYFPASDTLHPDPRNQSFYDAKYAEFVRLYPALKPTFDGLGNL